jgi:hypothetical protein
MDYNIPPDQDQDQDQDLDLIFSKTVEWHWTPIPKLMYNFKIISECNICYNLKKNCKCKRCVFKICQECYKKLGNNKCPYCGDNFLEEIKKKRKNKNKLLSIICGI